MSGIKIGALLLIIAGFVGLAYGRFTFTRDTHRAVIGPISLTARETRDVAIPVWAAAGAIVLGSLMLMTSKRGMRT
jgi:hypothetical protein